MRYLNRVLPCMLALGFIHGASGLHAQNNYPDKPLHWIIPYAPGGGTDVIARPIALKLGEVLGQPITYDNRGGGGGIIAGEIVAKSAPDGYTFLVGSGNTHTFPTLLNDKIGYDPVKDYAPITNFVIVPNVLVAHPSFPVKSVKELVAYGKANPNKINWASSGNGSGGHLALITFAKAAGIQIVHVPFKGGWPCRCGHAQCRNAFAFCQYRGLPLSHSSGQTPGYCGLRTDSTAFISQRSHHA